MAKNKKKQAPLAANKLNTSMTLDELTQRANDLHATVLAGVRTTLIAAKDCGIALALCRSKLKHGEWTPWLEENFAASEYTAQRYMRIARDWPILEGAGFLKGDDLPGIAMADEMIRSLHGNKSIPSSNKPPPPTREARRKNIKNAIDRNVEHWPDEAIELLESQIVPVIDSIDVYVQEQFGDASYPDVLPRIALRDDVGKMALIRTFAERIGELDEDEQAKLRQLLDRPGTLKHTELTAEHPDNAVPPGPNPRRRVRRPPPNDDASGEEQ